MQLVIFPLHVTKHAVCYLTCNRRCRCKKMSLHAVYIITKAAACCKLSWMMHKVLFIYVLLTTRPANLILFCFVLCHLISLISIMSHLIMSHIILCLLCFADILCQIITFILCWWWDKIPKHIKYDTDLFVYF